MLNFISWDHASFSVNSLLGAWGLPISFLIMSILGSWHCVGMCGPIACSPQVKWAQQWYHSGRMVSYVLLGAFSGGLGNQLLLSSWPLVRYFAAVMMAIILIYFGLNSFFSFQLRIKPPSSKFNLSTYPKMLIHKLFRTQFWTKYSLRSLQSFLLGFASAFLPCGWLYTFVAAATATRSAISGAMVLFIFWLGTLPALLFLQSALTHSLKNIPHQIKKVMGVFFILAGLYSLVFHLLH